MSHQVAKTNAETEEAKRKAEEEEWGHFGSWDFGILVIYCWIITDQHQAWFDGSEQESGVSGKGFLAPLPGMGREIDT